MIRHLKKYLPQSVRNRYRSKWQKIQKKLLKYKFARFIVRPPLPKLENGEKYLHLGCGDINHPKFINIDAVPYPHVHYVQEIENLSNFENDSVDLIYASHCLEHFEYRKVPKVLAEWYRVLKSNGILRISVPDFDLLLDIYSKNKNDMNTIIEQLLGGQENKYNYHLTIFNRFILTEYLQSIGFREMRGWDPYKIDPIIQNDFSTSKKMVNGEWYLISLNMEAVK